MKTKLILTIAATAILGTSSLFAGPGGNSARKATRTIPVNAPAMKCDTMTITTNAKAGGRVTVPCANFSKVRAAECKLACAS